MLNKNKMKTALKNLITALENKTIVEHGSESINSKGVKYRYDIYKLSANNTPYYLRVLFEKAAAAVTGKYYSTQFTAEGFNFYFDRNKAKGQADGKISYKKLVILSNQEAI